MEVPIAQVPKQEAPQITWFECKSTESWSIGSGKTQRLPESSRDLSLKEDMKKKNSRCKGWGEGNIKGIVLMSEYTLRSDS